MEKVLKYYNRKFYNVIKWWEYTKLEFTFIYTSFLKSLPSPNVAAAAKSLQSCPILCDPIDGSPPGSPIPGILQARILEWPYRMSLGVFNHNFNFSAYDWPVHIFYFFLVQSWEIVPF